jgi:hypothetical protein
VGGVILAAVGCASRAEWQTWREHPTHFASNEHLTFSIKNQNDSARHAKVTRQDIAAARQEGWWGKPVAVAQEQIIER